jgi:hypothetical protein
MTKAREEEEEKGRKKAVRIKDKGYSLLHDQSAGRKKKEEKRRRKKAARLKVKDKASER